MSQQGLSERRSHFDHSPFESMTRELVEEEYSGRQKVRKWKGYHVFGTDGSSVILPNVKGLAEDFGVSGYPGICPTANISLFSDMLSGWTLDASIHKYPFNEREAAKDHIKHMKTIRGIGKSILLCDRGYPSENFIKHVESNGMFYVMRVQKSWAGEVERAPTGESSLTWRGIQMRVYKFLLPSGELETLVSNLPDNISCAELKELYFLRWNIETGLDILKNKIQAENFTGHTKNSILQDFWVSVTLMNLVMVVSAEADVIVQKKCNGKSNKNMQKPNVSQLVASLKDDFVFACIHKCGSDFDDALAGIIDEVSRATIPIRKNRAFKRKSHHKKRHFPFNRKSNI